MRYVRRYPEEPPALAELLPPHRHASHHHQRPPRPRGFTGQRRGLDERLPTSRLVVIEAGHFVWEEAPTEYASIILDSIRGDCP
jgi:pimeloyl-ACP methyl ester carboxylesterase